MGALDSKYPLDGIKTDWWVANDKIKEATWVKKTRILDAAYG